MKNINGLHTDRWWAAGCVSWHCSNMQLMKIKFDAASMKTMAIQSHKFIVIIHILP